MSKEQLRKEFDNQINKHDDFWISEKAFDWFYSKLQEKDRIQFNALLKWHEERRKLESQLAEHKLTENASEFLDEYRAMKKQLANRQALEEYQKLKSIN